MSSALSQLWLSALPKAALQRLLRRAHLDQELSEHLDRARRRCGFALDPQVFLPYWASRQGEDTSTVFLHVEELYLACGCCLGDKRALHAFEAQCLPTVRAAVARFRFDAAQLDDFLQSLRQQLFVASPGGRPKIAEYSGQGDLAAWLRVFSVRAALKMVRGRNPERAIDEELSSVPALDESPELKFLRAQHVAAFKSALNLALARLTDRDQLLLRQHYLDGLTIDQLSGLYRVHRSSCARWINQATEQLLEKTRSAFMDQTGLSRSDCHQVFRQVRSQLDITLRSLFAPPAG